MAEEALHFRDSAAGGARSMTKPLVLVTGGAGFIGSNIVAELIDTSAARVVVCDRLRGADLGKWRNIAKHAIVDFVAPDGLWPWLEGAGRSVDAVVHMGAISSTQEMDADLIIHTNFGLSRDLFNWCAKHSKRFIYASSAATYGDGALGFEDDSDLDALTALRPLNAYGWSKALFDIYAVREASAGRAPPQWAGLKFFNVYGPNEGHKGAMSSMVAQMWPAVVAGLPVRLFRSYRAGWSDGGQERDFVYVRDVAQVVAWLLGRPELNSVVNVGSGAARSFESLARAVFQSAARDPVIEFIDMPESLRERYQYFTQASLNGLQSIGYNGIFTSLEAGVADYVRSYLTKPDSYR